MEVVVAIDEKVLNEYMVSLANAAGIPEAERPAFLAKEDVKKFAHSSLEAVAREKGRADKATSEATRVYEENLKIFANNKAAVEQAEKRVQSYVGKFGELPGGGNPNDPNAVRAAVNADVVDKKTFEERIKVTEENTIGLIKSVGKITAKHLKDYNEEPDLDAIQKIALEQGMTADKAYQEWRRPKDEERAKTAHDAEVKKAREEGEMEGRSKVAASAISSPERDSPFMSNLRKAGQVNDTPRESFVKGWREAGVKGGAA